MEGITVRREMRKKASEDPALGGNPKFEWI